MSSLKARDRKAWRLYYPSNHVWSNTSAMFRMVWNSTI